MTKLTQEPAEVNIAVGVDDSFSTLIDFDVVLTGYTITAKVIGKGGTETSFTVTNTDLSTGKVTISLTATQLTAIGAGTHHWYFRYANGAGTIARRALAGTFKIVAYPT